ncbi:MAG: hypothetical protein NWF01_11130 [Candidatus Bathyarchaeota archaeon]|nr:hypothetical protein [Candidatus Bathyarchaeota archaeon]
MLEAESKLVNRPTVTGKKSYSKFFVYLPSEIVKDSAFPFKEDDKLKIKIDTKNRRLIIEKP